MRYFSMFSGIAGFEEGIRRNDPSAECVGFSEIDKYAIQIYKTHFKEHKNYGDATRIVPEDLPDFDLLVGGFPCQAFSIAGKRKGFDDARGTLFFDIARIAKAKQPMFMLLENVKGLVSHDGGKTLAVILETLQELGYYVNYEIRNSKDYGVPQNRERIFLECTHIKCLESGGRTEMTNTSERIIEEWLFQISLNSLKEVKKVQGTASKDWVLGYLICREISLIQDLSGENILVGISMDMDEKSCLFKGDPWPNIVMWLNKTLGVDCSEAKPYTISTEISKIIDSKIYTHSKMFQAILLATVQLRNLSSHSWSRVLSNLTVIQEGTKYARINNENETALITEYGVAHIKSELQDPAKYFALRHLGDFGGREVFPIGEDGGEHIKVGKSEPQITGTINSCMMKGGNKQDANASVLVSHNTRIRRLTPTECERLQGYPDGWTARGLSSIMDICVNINPAIENLSLKNTASCTISVGANTELRSCQKENKESARFVIDQLVPDSYVTDIINHGKGMAIRFNQSETSNTEEQTNPQNTKEEKADQPTLSWLRVLLVGSSKKEKLSTILISTPEIMRQIICSSVRIDDNIIGVIILLNSSEPNYSSVELSAFNLASIESISDSQRYKTLGNSVTVNVIEAIMSRILLNNPTEKQ